MLLAGEVTATAWLPSCDVNSARQCSYQVSAQTAFINSNAPHYFMNHVYSFAFSAGVVMRDTKFSNLVILSYIDFIQETY